MFDFYEGVGSFPIPVRIASMLVNWLYARRKLGLALVEGQVLSTCTYLLRNADQPADKPSEEIAANSICAFSRIKMTSQVIDKVDYRQALGDRAIMNNIPFLATADAESANMLLNFDPWSAKSVYRLFNQLYTDRVETLRETHPILPGFEDILMTQDLHRHPLLDDVCCGYQGVYCRVAFVESCVNEVKLASIRQSIVQFDYSVLEKMAFRRKAGAAAWKPREARYSDYPEMLLFDQY